MQYSKEDFLRQADEFERMAALASTEVLRCRYRSMARYLSILADQVAASSAPDVGPTVRAPHDLVSQAA
jgi:hypothetical protein